VVVWGFIVERAVAFEGTGTFLPAALF